MFFPATPERVFGERVGSGSGSGGEVRTDTGDGATNAAMALRKRRNGMAVGADRNHGKGFASGTSGHALPAEPAGGGRGPSGRPLCAAGLLRLELQPAKLTFRDIV